MGDRDVESTKRRPGRNLGNLEDLLRDAPDISGCHIDWDEVVSGCDLSYQIPKKDEPDAAGQSSKLEEQSFCKSSDITNDRDGALKEDVTCELVYMGDLDDLLRDAPDISGCHVDWDEVVSGCDLSYLVPKADAAPEKFFRVYGDDEVEIAAEKGRSFRKNDAKLFKKYYKYYDDVSERRTCIWSNDMYTMDDKSSGIMWVGVCGKDTMCVVTMTGDVDLSRACYGLSNYSKDTVLYDFRKTVISEMEDLKSTIYQRTGKSIKLPFGVVSVTPSPHTDDKAVKEGGLQAEERHKALNPFLDFCMSSKVAHHYFLEKRNAVNFYLDEFRSAKLIEVEFDEKESIKHEESRKRLISTMEKIIQARSDFAEYDEQKAIEFLKQEMKENSTVNLSVHDTIKIAISAFQHLLKREFEANEIEVSYIDPHYKIRGRRHNRNPDYNLKVLDIESMQDLLAIINNTGPSKAAQTTEAKKSKGLLIVARKAKHRALQIMRRRRRLRIKMKRVNSVIHRTMKGK